MSSNEQQKAKEYLRASRVVVDPETYSVISVAHRDWDEILKSPELSPEMISPFVLFKDGWEVTLIVTEKNGAALVDSDFDVQVETGFRLVSFDVELEFDVVGYMALVTGIAAAEGISILAFASFKRDHLFVRQDDLARFLLSMRGHVAEIC